MPKILGYLNYFPSGQNQVSGHVVYLSIIIETNENSYEKCHHLRYGGPHRDLQ